MEENTEDFKKKALEKWSPIIESMGVTGSRANWMNKYASILDGNLSTHTPSGSTQSTFEGALLPVAMQIASQTIGQHLVSVNPIGIGSDKLDQIKKEVKSINRDKKIDSVIEGSDYKEMKVEDHPEYKDGLPSGNLFYMDFKYDSKKKKKKK